MKLRSISFAVATLALAASANALTIDWTKMQGASVIAFSAEAIDLFKANQGKINPLGTTTAVGTDGWTFSLPITTIEINSSLKIASGSAVGSALDIVRNVFDDDTGAVTKKGITLANFTLDYINKKVLADTTPRGVATKNQFAVYNFVAKDPLALKYKFPLTITGHEVLDSLTLTPDAVSLFAANLGLEGDAVITAVTNAKFGTLTQDISTNARKPAASKVPYVPAP
jgi:hypothetical protein